MYPIRVELHEFDTQDPEWLSGQLGVLLEAMCQMNERYLARFPATPSLYQSGVRYIVEKQELWCTIPGVIARGGGDCDDLAPWRVADLRYREGIDAKPLVSYTWDKRGPMFHVRVLTPYGIEDPSRELGMR